MKSNNVVNFIRRVIAFLLKFSYKVLLISIKAKNKSKLYREASKLKIEYKIFSGAILVFLWGLQLNLPTAALSTYFDRPEEILRSQIITAARSPIDGKPITAGEYAQLEARLQQRSTPAKLSPKVRSNVFLLRIRKIIKSVFPFIDI